MEQGAHEQVAGDQFKKPAKLLLIVRRVLPQNALLSSEQVEVELVPGLGLIVPDLDVPQLLLDVAGRVAERVTQVD
jgi:hypothetical protein